MTACSSAAVLLFVWTLSRWGFGFSHAGQFSHKGSLRTMRHGIRFENTMFGIEFSRGPRIRPPSNGFWWEFWSPLVFDGECENRNPEADSGFPGIKNSTFRLLAKAFAPNFPSGPVCENCWGDFYARIAQGVLSSSPLPAILLKNNKRIMSREDKTR